VNGAATQSISNAVTKKWSKGTGGPAGDECQNLITYRKARRAQTDQDDETWTDADHANTLNAFDVGDTRTTHAIVQQPLVDVASTLQGGGGSPRGQRNDAEGAAGGHLIPQVSPTLTRYNLDSRSPQSEEQQRIVSAVLDAQAFTQNQREEVRDLGDQAGALAAQTGTHQQTFLREQMSVRRLTPIECERLMGWPDNWTAPDGVKASDSKRYAACGDGIVSHVAYWIGCRIQMIEEES
jgi:site-specific DNA-cytosine methylase